jgi:hypothetical protein
LFWWGPGKFTNLQNVPYPVRPAYAHYVSSNRNYVSLYTYINAKFFELLSRCQVNHMLVDTSLALQQLLVQQVERYGGPGLGIHRHAELVGMSSRNSHMT